MKEEQERSMVTINPAHIVGTGGAIGALLRYAVTQQIEGEAFPAGTVTVNVVGSFVLAALTFASTTSGV
jgi:CrcB protein